MRLLPIRMGADDVTRVAGSFFVGSTNRSRDLSGYWVLLILAAAIASAGVVADSTATVIGAMIVAPLMRPMLGIAAALVLADRKPLVRSALLVLGSMAVVIGTGFVLGLMTRVAVVAATNGQVAARVNPRLIDLVAALATGLVGAFAAVRSDVSDSLPGVAIAISLVPPLAVVGLTLESGQPDQALGALLLFSTNVAAIVATGVLLFQIAGLRTAARDAGRPVGELRGATLAMVAAAIVLIAIPLGVGSYQVTREQIAVSDSRSVIANWASQQGWTVVDVSLRQRTLVVTALGQSQTPSIAGLRQALDAAGMGEYGLEVKYSLGGTLVSPGR